MAMTTYTLRILGRYPDTIPLGRLGEYIQEFAELLGADNQPRFQKIKRASIGIVAEVPNARRAHTATRLREAQQRPDSRAGKVLQRLGVLLGEDHTQGASILDNEGNEIAHLQAIEPANDDGPVIRQIDTVDGIVTGLIGSDDTMNLHLRDDENRDINLIVKDMDLARRILEHFRRGVLRVQVDGLWERTSNGWVPKSNRCVVQTFEVLEPVSIRDNGWDAMSDPVAAWKDLRGIH
jgi:hypothetical protein